MNIYKIFFMFSLLCFSLQSQGLEDENCARLISRIADNQKIYCGTCVKLCRGLYLSILHLAKKTHMKLAEKAVVLGQTKNQPSVTEEIVIENNSEDEEALFSSNFLLRREDGTLFVIKKRGNIYHATKALHYEEIDPETTKNDVLDGDSAVLVFTGVPTELPRNRFVPEGCLPDIALVENWEILFTAPIFAQNVVIGFKEAKWQLEPQVVRFASLDGYLAFNQLLGRCGMSGGVLRSPNNMIVAVLSQGHRKSISAFGDGKLSFWVDWAEHYQYATEKIDDATTKITLMNVLIASLLPLEQVQKAFNKGLLNLPL